MRFLTQRALLVAALGIFSTAVWALPVTLDFGTVSPGLQQQQNSPLVIGHSGNNPAGFDYTDNVPSPPNPIDLTSPEYTVQQIRDIVGNFFSVQVDVNQAGQAVQLLYRFSMSVDGVEEFLYDTPDGTALQVVNQGNGRSDMAFSLFDLSSFGDDQIVTFRAVYDSNDGFESFFINAEDDPNEEPDPVIPEPATITLLGLGLAAGTVARRRRLV